MHVIASLFLIAFYILSAKSNLNLFPWPLPPPDPSQDKQKNARNEQTKIQNYELGNVKFLNTYTQQGPSNTAFPSDQYMSQSELQSVSFLPQVCCCILSVEAKWNHSLARGSVALGRGCRAVSADTFVTFTPPYQTKHSSCGLRSQLAHSSTFSPRLALADWVSLPYAILYCSTVSVPRSSALHDLMWPPRAEVPWNRAANIFGKWRFIVIVAHLGEHRLTLRVSPWMSAT